MRATTINSVAAASRNVRGPSKQAARAAGVRAPVRARVSGLSIALFAAATVVEAQAARAATERPTVHAIYAHMRNAPQNDLALKRFTISTQRFGLGPVEVVDIDEDPAPQAAEKVRAGIDRVRALDLPAGQTLLDDAAAEVAASGGGGLDANRLSDLYLYRGWAVSRADFNPEHVPAATARAQAYENLARAAMLVPGRALNPQQFPPVVLEDWARAVADVRARGQTTLVVRAAPEALVSCDGGQPLPGPATFVGLAQGEHLIHVDEPGWAAWGATIALSDSSVDVQIPSRRELVLDDAAAAAHARRMGTMFALVAQPRPGQDGGLTLSLRLVDSTGKRVDGAIEPLAGDAGALDASVMRLDEHARRISRMTEPPSSPSPSPSMAAADQAAALPSSPPVLVGPPPPDHPRFGDNPGAWAREHWPLLVAVGAMVTTALVLTIGVANDRPAR